MGILLPPLVDSRDWLVAVSELGLFILRNV